jgi:hypothetical protein
LKQRKILIIILATAAALTVALFGVAYAIYLNYTSYRQTQTPTRLTLRLPEKISGAGSKAASDGETINSTATATSINRQPTVHMRLNQTRIKAIPTELDADAGAGKTPQTKNQNVPFCFKE